MGAFQRQYIRIKVLKVLFHDGTRTVYYVCHTVYSGITAGLIAVTPPELSCVTTIVECVC